MTARVAERLAGTWRRNMQFTWRIWLRLVSRRQVRNSDLAVGIIAVLIGVLAALGIAVVNRSVGLLHALMFGVPFDGHLSDGSSIERWRLFAAPCLGGLAYGVFAALVRRWRPGDIVDAIEANAMYGGRMSVTDSLRLTVLTVFSGGVGASVGLEAAYTQLGAGMASRLGRGLRLRRADLRTMVGCGAAAAIAAAFNAPLAGAFYAFELIIGSYTIGALAPVALAALAGTLLERQLSGADPVFYVSDLIALTSGQYLLLALLGVVAGALGIAAMRGVTLVEEWGRRIAVPAWLRPAAGGAAVGLIALVFPQVLGSGHGGIKYTVSAQLGFLFLAGLLLAKLVASAISIGSGFRGGMFSSSLFLGALLGSTFGVVAALVFTSLPPDHTVFILAGMGAVAAAVVGAPVTMIMLVLEVTANFYATIGVTVSVVIAWVVVRNWFGYSFATWRFHVRGVPLRGAHDIGWLHDLTVTKLMRRDFQVVSRDTTLRALRERFPLGATKRVFVLEESGAYAGFVDVDEAHGADLDARAEELTAGELARGKDFFLIPGQSVRSALDLFVAAETETLAVVSDIGHRRVVGYLTESYALRRYSRELEARRREEYGFDEIASPTHAPVTR